MKADLNIHINETGKFRAEYLTSAIQNLNKLDNYKNYVFNNINKNISDRVTKLQNLKSRINRIKEILPKLNDYSGALTIKSKRYYPADSHTYYHYIHLEDNPDTINNLINSNYTKNNPNFLKINTKKPLYDKNIEFFGTIQRENLEEGLNMQELSNVQKRYQDLANELYNIRFKNIGSSLFTELNDLVYDKSQYFDTSFSFMDKKLIQKADQLWKVSKKDLTQVKRETNRDSYLYEDVPKYNKNLKKSAKIIQEAPKSITSKVKIEKYVNKKVLLEKPTEKQEFNLPTTINLGGVAELNDEIVEETPQTPEDNNIYPEREDLDIDFENPTDINNLIMDDDIDLPVDIITRKNLENLTNKNIINDDSSNNLTKVNYNYQTATQSSTTTAPIAPSVPVSAPEPPPGVVFLNSGSGPVPPPPPPPPMPVVKITAPQKKEEKKEEKKEDEKVEESNNNVIKEPEMSMADQLASVKLKKVGETKVKEPPKPKSTNLMDLLKQQIDLRFKNLRMHEDKNDEGEENEEDEED